MNSDINTPPDDATVESVFRAAMDAQRRGDLDEAREGYLEALRLDADHAEAMHCLGNIDAISGRLDDAEALVRRAMALQPMKASYVNSLGNIQKARGQLEDAARLYNQAISIKPTFAQAYCNHGEVLLKQGRADEALEACQRALELEPDFAGAYDMLGRAMNNLRHYEDAVSAFRRAALLRPDFALTYSNLGHVLRAMGRLQEAAEALEHAVMLAPDLERAWKNLGTVRIALDDTSGAAEAFRKVIELNPDDMEARLNLGIVHHTAGDFREAVATYRAALEVDPDNARAHLNLGIVQNEMRRTHDAEAAFRRALALAPDWPEIYAELGALCEETNRLDEATEVLDRGLALAPDDTRLLLEAAKTDRRQGEPARGIERLARVDAVALNPRLAEQVHWELAYLHDRAGSVDAAWQHVTAANDIASHTVRRRNVDPRRFLDKIDALQALFASADVAGWANAPPAERAAPVFMIGFPRSGTTLTDLVLDSHPMIRTVEEKPTITGVEQALAARPPGYPSALAEVGPDDIAELRRTYFEALDRALGDGAPDGPHGPDEGAIIVDKMPIRTVHSGLIWRLFPDAPFIFCLRHPCDVVLSGLMQHYALNDAFANFFTLEDSARIYDKVMTLWQTYNERLPLNVHVVRYESLVDDLEGQARALADFVGVDFDPAMLDYRAGLASRGRINTNSYHQVTEGLYQRSRERWKRYETYLAPVLDTLAPHIERFGYDK